MFSFELISQSKDSRARAGVVQTDHGKIETPVFMPVGTMGSVKSLTPEELLDAGAQMYWDYWQQLPRWHGKPTVTKA